MTLLVDWQIKEAVQRGDLVIEPFEEEYLNPASLDVRLGNEFGILELAEGKSMIIPSDKESYRTDTYILNAYVLPPGQFVLACLIEKTGFGRTIAGQLIGKSSLARLGLMIHVTAGWADNGWVGRYTLELVNVGPHPILLQTGMRIAQIKFFQTALPKEGYDKKKTSKYQNQSGMVGSLYWKNYESIE